jgi:hypothetical protein
MLMRGGKAARTLYIAPDCISRSSPGLHRTTGGVVLGPHKCRTLAATSAIVQNIGACGEGVVLQSEFGSFMNGLMIPAMQSLGVISPTKFAFFLTKNVVTAKVMKFTTKPPSEDQNNCGAIREVGDPINGIYMPLINTSGYNYHVQELDFFSMAPRRG